MANNKNPDQKQPGEKGPGKFHYNPGNMSGKTAGTSKDGTEPGADSDKVQSRQKQQDQKRGD